MAARKSGETIEITRAELDSAVVTAAVERAKEAAQVPLRREVGAADLTKGFNIGLQMLKNIAAAVAAAVLYTVVYEVFFSRSNPITDEELYQGAALRGAIQAAIFVLFLTAVQGIDEGSPEKAIRMFGIALIPALVLGAMMGVMGQWLYVQLYDMSNFDGLDWVRGVSWVPRVFAIGVAIGFGFRSVQKGINAVIGGAVGGFVGGAIFNIIYNVTASSSDDTGTVSRLIGYAVIGVLVGAGIGLADAVRKSLWLQIATGGMAGKQFIVYQQNAVLGSSSSADITLIKDPEIAGMHVRLNQKSGGTTFEVLEGASDVLLNGEATRRGKLSDGVLLQVGGTVLQFGEKNVEMPTIA
jgi:hypothetical protein